MGDEDQIQFDEDEFRDAGAAAASDKEQSSRTLFRPGLGRRNDRAAAKSNASSHTRRARRNGAFVQHGDVAATTQLGSVQDGENIFESRAYMSNQPNVSNKIGNGANNLAMLLSNADKLTNILEESHD